MGVKLHQDGHGPLPAYSPHLVAYQLHSPQFIVFGRAKRIFIAAHLIVIAIIASITSIKVMTASDYWTSLHRRLNSW